MSGGPLIDADGFWVGTLYAGTADRALFVTSEAIAAVLEEARATDAQLPQIPLATGP